MLTETTTPRYVHIFMEANPNPASIKFSTNHQLVPDGVDFHYESLEEAGQSPLAKVLFGYDFVDKVFLMGNFVTVTRKADYDWDEIQFLVRDVIRTHLEQGHVAIELAATDLTQLTEIELTEVEMKIRDVLDEYIRPAVEGDGGAINLHGFEAETGRVTVHLRGSCSGCPSSTVTLKNGIEQLLRRMVPEVQTVEAVAM
jgi:NFU1 iron-sulfur cluster scaffold homolog, mitochondrial